MDVRTVERLRNSTFRKSDKSGDIGCVEVAFAGDAAGVRDSYDRSGPMLAFAGDAWRQFIATARTGHYDLHS
jgi:hypothetical protein